MIKAAVHGRAITKETGGFPRGLVVLRNLAAHDPTGTKITSEKAAEFMLLARGVLYALTRSPLPAQAGPFQTPSTSATATPSAAGRVANVCLAPWHGRPDLVTAALVLLERDGMSRAGARDGGFLPTSDDKNSPPR